MCFFDEDYFTMFCCILDEPYEVVVLFDDNVSNEFACME